MRSYLLILGEREAVAWVLRHQRMAFPARRRAEVGQLEAEDELLIYTTRGCWHNPERDRGRVIGRAYATSPVRPLQAPVEIAGRVFESGCELDVRTLTPYLTGVELAPLVERLAAFPAKSSWSIRLRRPLLELPVEDAELLRGCLADAESPADELVDGYLEAIKPVTGRGAVSG
ncbi:hypothetical protein [Streptomyces sp. NBC_00199]|uniref:hypothetical protein n=1 Tax=Streptomyces sp. NBC_00199 TaxID=2975678 RepID=UPI00224DDEE5|nr:hypothetical protein [Streptomyces sp. NBC_00199]MCX5267445.1 hypothetical protein [Streptomyces sp. NBC_00199]